jgi:hypothetical protein
VKPDTPMLEPRHRFRTIDLTFALDDPRER